MSSHPPSWAQSLLALVAPARHRDGIAGDLLEEYHEAQLPQRGERAADAWYVGQVLIWVWRAARWWGLALGATILVRDAIDIYVPTHDYYLRSAVTTYLAVSIYAACGIRAGWYFGRVPSGAVVGIAAGVIASVIGLVSPFLFLGVEWAGQTTSPDVWEALDVPVPILLVFGIVLGSVGAAIGKGAGSLNRPRNSSA
jgi:hypothetical protein